MSVGLLVVTHNRIGQEIIAAAASIVKQQTVEIASLSIPADLAPQDVGKYADKVRESICRADDAEGLLILTDMYGATPNNLARYFCAGRHATVVSGLNLSMLVRILNYRHKSLAELAIIAIEAVTKSAIRDTAQ